MVSGRSPWGPATPSDRNFRKYINNPNFLLEVLPISRSFNEILKQIFHLRESARISLPRLREEIIKLDTFYPSEADLSNVSENAREPAHKHITYPSHQAMAGYTCAEVSHRSSDSSADNRPPKPQRDYRSSAPAVQQPGDTAVVDRTSSHLRIYDGGRSLSRTPLSRCSTCSFSECEGPVTPETRPHEPLTNSSDLLGQKGLIFYSLPPPSYIHPGYLYDVRLILLRRMFKLADQIFYKICLPVLSPETGMDSVILNYVDTGGMMQVVSTI
jgi:hypothetical protein